MLYPYISNRLAERNYSKAIQEYKAGISEKQAAALQEEREKAALYNEFITYTSRNNLFPDQKNIDMPVDYYTTLNTRGVMGYLSIPEINLSLPIYHGTEDKILRKGVGHMANTTLPIGGVGNHCVLTGHSGLPSARLFNDLEHIKIGDILYLHILDETLAYMVDNILVVEPTSTEFLLPTQEQDYVSLVTCTPYGINSHRLIVRGSRIPFIEEETGEISIDTSHSSHNPEVYIAAVFIFVILSIFFILSRLERHL